MAPKLVHAKKSVKVDYRIPMEAKDRLKRLAKEKGYQNLSQYLRAIALEQLEK